MITKQHSKYPTLSNEIGWGPVTSRFQTYAIPDESYISNISIVPMVGDQYVMMQIESGAWELIGGTLEPNEPYMDGLKREIAEELGAELLSFHLFGHFSCHSTADKPYRPHIPHPDFIRLLGYGEVQISGKPLNPEDGETVIAVEVVSIGEAISRFLQQGRSDLAELYQFVDDLRKGVDLA